MRPRRPMLGSLALVLGLAAAACSRSAGVGEPGTGLGPLPWDGRPDFYSSAHPVPEGALGEVLASEPVLGPAGPAASAWRVLYRSRSLPGGPVAVSGLVVRPDGPAPAAGWPVLGWAHGTTGSADVCAPSRAGVGAIPHLDRMLAAGYVVAATDYEGLGTPGPHPYLVGESEGRSVLDAVRAARQLVPQATGPVVAWGHSQGGQAVLWAGELAPSYAAELPLVGVAAFAPAVRQETFLELAGGRGPGPLAAGFTVAAAAGLAAARADLQVADVLSEAALTRLDLLESACIAEVTAVFAGLPGGVLHPEPQRLEAWRPAVEANQAGRRASPVPVLVAQGDRDVLVPPAASERYRQVACAVGTDVELHRDAEADHGSIVARAWEHAERWSAGRRAGAVPGGC